MISKPGSCLVGSCDEEPVAGAMFCGSAGNRHLTENWLGRLVRLSDGSYASTVGPTPEQPFRPVWLRHLKSKDMTGAA